MKKVDSVARGIVHSTFLKNGKKCCYTLAKETAASFIQIVQVLRKNSPFSSAIYKQLRNSVYTKSRESGVVGRRELKGGNLVGKKTKSREIRRENNFS